MDEELVEHARTLVAGNRYVVLGTVDPDGRPWTSPVYFSADGDLYMLEYGTAWFQGNDDARLVKIEYNGGNRKPDVRMAADKTKGAVPFTATLTSKGTKDYDHDDMTYEWKFMAADGSVLATRKEAEPCRTILSLRSMRRVGSMLHSGTRTRTPVASSAQGLIRIP